MIRAAFQQAESIFFILVCAIILLSIPGCLNDRFYQPNQTVYETPDQYGLHYEEVFFRSKDGTKLHGWFIPALGDAVGTVIHFHGNFGNLTYYFNQICWLPSNNFNVFTFDYRGYGQSEGAPSRHGIYEDSVSAIEYIMSKPTITPSNVYIFGQSLGGVNAIVAVAKNDFPEIRAVAIEGAFYSYRAEAQDIMGSTVKERVGKIPWLSLQIRLISFFSVTNSYSPHEFIDQVSPIPILLIHCNQDSFVSYHHSEWLYEKAKEPKYLWEIGICSHLQLFSDKRTGYKYCQKLVHFFYDHQPNSK